VEYAKGKAPTSRPSRNKHIGRPVESYAEWFARSLRDGKNAGPPPKNPRVGPQFQKPMSAHNQFMRDYRSEPPVRKIPLPRTLTNAEIVARDLPEDRAANIMPWD
jgi:hypothetical protein